MGFTDDQARESIMKSQNAVKEMKDRGQSAVQMCVQELSLSIEGLLGEIIRLEDRLRPIARDGLDDERPSTPTPVCPGSSELARKLFSEERTVNDLRYRVQRLSECLEV